MPASEILNIVLTVGTIQVVCDLIAYWRVFSQEPYQRALERVSRAKFKLDQVEKSNNEQQATSTNTTTTSSKKNTKSVERNLKKMKRAQDDHKEALANVTRLHMMPNMLISLIFLILMKVMGTEQRGKILAILPFKPFPLMKRLLTGRGLEFPDNFLLEGVDGTAINDVGQLCSFTFIYFLTALSVKFYVHQLFGMKPPQGAESIFTLYESPQGQRIMKSMGIDPVDLKAE